MEKEKMKVVGNQMSKEQMMHWIMALGFCGDDMRLYIDTHPEDENALEYYKQCMELVNSARNAYCQVYGALSIQDELNGNAWDWSKGKLPWEGGAN